MIAVGGNEIGSVAVRSDFNYFSLSQTAEIENFAARIPGETFGDEIFFFGEEAEASLGDDGKIAMDFFDEVGEFVGSLKAGEFRAAGWVESFAEGDAFFKEFDCFPAFAEMLSRCGHGVERGGAVGKIGEKFFDGVDLGAGFGGVGRLGGGAANFLRGRFLSDRDEREKRSGDDEPKKAERGDRGGGHVLVLRRREIGIIILDPHPGCFWQRVRKRLRNKEMSCRSLQRVQKSEGKSKRDDGVVRGYTPHCFCKSAQRVKNKESYAVFAGGGLYKECAG